MSFHTTEDHSVSPAGLRKFSFFRRCKNLTPISDGERTSMHFSDNSLTQAVVSRVKEKDIL